MRRRVLSEGEERGIQALGELQVAIYGEEPPTRGNGMLKRSERWKVGRPGSVISDTPQREHDDERDVEFYGGYCVAESIQTDEKARILAASLDMLSALRDLIINANRLCDRNQGGTYEEDCRRSIAAARAAVEKAEGRA